MTFCILTSLMLPCNCMDIIKTGCSLENTLCPCQKNRIASLVCPCVLPICGLCGLRVKNIMTAFMWNPPPSCAFVMKSGNLNFLEPSGPLHACNGTALPFIFLMKYSLFLKMSCAPWNWFG